MTKTINIHDKKLAPIEASIGLAIRAVIGVAWLACLVLSIVFAAMKLDGALDWSWWWVAFPVLAFLGLFFLVLVAAVAWLVVRVGKK